jgi:hypothetical protein
MMRQTINYNILLLNAAAPPAYTGKQPWSPSPTHPTR